MRIDLALDEAVVGDLLELRRRRLGVRLLGHADHRVIAEEVKLPVVDEAGEDGPVDEGALLAHLADVHRRPARVLADWPEVRRVGDVAAVAGQHLAAAVRRRHALHHRPGALLFAGVVPLAGRVLDDLQVAGLVGDGVELGNAAGKRR